MKMLFRAVVLCSMVLSLRPCAAQSPKDARIVVIHPGSDALKKDLKSVLDLTLPAEQSQWANIEDFIDTFFMGTDGSRPIYIQHLTGIKPNAALYWFPLAPTQPLFKSFRENAESLGYEVVREQKDTSLYKVSQDPEFGWVRVFSDQKYVLGVLGTKDTQTQLRSIVTAATMLSQKTDGNAYAEVLNTDFSPEAIQHRRQAYSETRRIAMDAIKKRPEESTTEFELRQLAVEQVQDEGERLMAEGELLSARLTLSSPKPNQPGATVDLLVRGIAKTALADAIAQYGRQPDAFHGIVRAPESAFSFRMNHPVDKLHQENFASFLNLTEKDVISRIKASKERTESEKQAASKVTTGVLDIARATVNSGWVNGFVESVPDGKGDFTSIAAFSAPTAATLTALLPELANASKGNVVQMNLDRQGEVAIHRIQLSEGFVDIFDRFFGTKKDIFVGIGPAHVWLSSGVSGLETLKKTIGSLTAPVATDVPLHVEIRFRPWVERLEEIAKKDSPGKTKEEQEKQRSDARIRDRALTAMTNGADRMVIHFTAKDGELKGTITSETDLLRFAGKMMSAFSKENLQ